LRFGRVQRVGDRQQGGVFCSVVKARRALAAARARSPIARISSWMFIAWFFRSSG
jgi:hypothetical protein